MGLAGMALILISQFTGKSKESQKPADTNTAEFTVEQYTKGVEERLTGLITSIDGVGRAQVMVTLQSTAETVYAQEEKRTTDKTQDPSGTERVGRTNQKENVEQKYILVDSEYGRRQALVVTQLQPKIQGVVIACEGADNVRVEQRLIHVVTTALGIPSTRVCVVKIS